MRGRVLPSTLDERHAERRADGRHDRRAASRRSPAGKPPIKRVFLSRTSRTAMTRRHRRHPRSRPDRARPGQPLHQRDAEPAGRRHRARGPLRRQRDEGLRLQRRHPARRDRPLRRGRPRPGAASSTSAPACSTTCWSTRISARRAQSSRSGMWSRCGLTAWHELDRRHASLRAMSSTPSNPLRHDPDRLARPCSTLLRGARACGRRPRPRA